MHSSSTQSSSCFASILLIMLSSIARYDYLLCLFFHESPCSPYCHILLLFSRLLLFPSLLLFSLFCSALLCSAFFPLLSSPPLFSSLQLFSSDFPTTNPYIPPHPPPLLSPLLLLLPLTLTHTISHRMPTPSHSKSYSVTERCSGQEKLSYPICALQRN